ncbi:MAG: hypothetical protein E6K53_10770 [Gammaproteobacteria bacterium]|nr:MAG: hypothetical protein E6K53_10770 [Gammaproteobacteria bacterium]
MTIIATLRDILLLRRGPQDLPYSPQLLVTMGALCVLVQLSVTLLRGLPAGAVIVGAVLWFAFALGALRLILTLRGFTNRFVQAATALLGCNLVFSIFALPVALLAGEPPTSPETMTLAQIVAGLISLPLLLWKIAVDAHVFRHSFEIPFLSGIVIALLWIVAAIALQSVGGVPAT